MNEEEKEKIGKGLYEQLKNNLHQGIQYPLTKEKLSKLTEKLFTNRKDPEKTINLPIEWKHCVWEENGEIKSCWKLMAGNLYTIVITGDEGKKEFDKLYRRNKEIHKGINIAP